MAAAHTHNEDLVRCFDTNERARKRKRTRSKKGKERGERGTAGEENSMRERRPAIE